MFYNKKKTKTMKESEWMNLWMNEFKYFIPADDDDDSDT